MIYMFKGSNLHLQNPSGVLTIREKIENLENAGILARKLRFELHQGGTEREKILEEAEMSRGGGTLSNLRERKSGPIFEGS